MIDQRRRFLRLCGVAGIAAIAGCSTGSQENGEQEQETEPSETPVETPVTTLTPDNAGELTQQRKLAATGGDSGDGFGTALSLSDSGGTALVGASGDGDPNGEEAGSAYVFDTTDGEWSQRYKVVPEDGDSGDLFGNSVALSGDGTTALLSAHNDDPNGSDSGSAYVFGAGDSGWSQQAKFAPEDVDSDDWFGYAVSLSSDGTTALVTVPRDEVSNDPYAGSAYVFAQSGGEWRRVTRIEADDGDNSDGFGTAGTLSSDGSTALVGANVDEDPNGDYAGSAYVFGADGGSWSQQAKLAADDGDSFDYFGSSVALSSDGTTALVGAPRDEDPNGEEAGSAYVFERADSAWQQVAKISPDDGDSSDEFGFATALSSDGTTAVVGAVGDEDPNGEDAGSVYVFQRSDGSWDESVKLVADDGDDGDKFGWSVALSDNATTVLLGAAEDDAPNGDGGGSAYVFSL